MNQKVAAARLSVFSNVFLVILKIVAGVMSSSVSILSEAIHSFMDLLAAFIAFFSVKISDRPADDRHPYGHGKFENISGVVEAILIFIAAFWIILEAVKKLLDPKPVDSIPLGMAVMTVSAIVNFFISRQLYKVAKKTDSIALEADALHLKTDVYTSLGVAAGLLLIWATGYHQLDPVVAILVALLILTESYKLFKKAYAPLLDVALPPDEIHAIESVICQYCTDSIGFHNLRTRKAGTFRYVDLHLNLPREMTVKEAHDLCDEIETKIKETLDHTEVTIHVEYF